MAVAGAGLTRVMKMEKAHGHLGWQGSEWVRVWRLDLLRQCKRSKRACPDAQPGDLTDRGLAASDFAHTGGSVISYGLRPACTA